MGVDVSRRFNTLINFIIILFKKKLQYFKIIVGVDVSCRFDTFIFNVISEVLTSLNLWLEEIYLNLDFVKCSLLLLLVDWVNVMDLWATCLIFNLLILELFVVF
ncbi:hypothetical protein ACOSQ2_000787 [Xanthoceras sorbifolium]